MGCSIAAHAAAPQSSPDYNCWHMSPLDPTRYELIIKLSSRSRLRTEQVLDTLKKAAIEGCVPADAHAGVCLGTYRPVTDSDTPDRKSRLLMDAKSPDGAAVFDYVIPNAPVHLVENTIVASQPRPGHITLPDIPHSPVVTAVIDTGVYARHPGLAANQIPGQDFMCGHAICNGKTDDDAGGHGTNMAGVIAAHDVQQNVSGIAWNTYFMPLRAFGPINVLSDDYTVGNAVHWALEQKVNVINVSWGSSCSLTFTQGELEAAQEHDVLVVVAAGNGGFNIDEVQNSFYPAKYKTRNMLVVMAYLDDPVQPLDSSNFGEKTVDLAAPGARFTAAPCEAGKCYTQTGGSTSIATAYASGAAALLKSLHPSWGAAMIKTHLLESSQSEPWLKGQAKWGRLVLDRAVNGPLHVSAPTAGSKWNDSQPQTVQWRNDYLSSLCPSLQIDISVNGSARQTLASGVPNSGNGGWTTVSLQGVPHGGNSVLRVSCPNVELTASSDPFIVEN